MNLFQLKKPYKWIITSSKRQFLAILIFVFLGIPVLGLVGYLVAIYWPDNRSSILASFVVGLIASIIGVLIAVLMAVVVVERYLEQRKREIEAEREREESHYKALWNLYIQGGIAGISENLIHISTYVVYGKDKYAQYFEDYAQFFENDVGEIPDKMGPFLLKFLIYRGRILDDEPEYMKSAGWSNERYSLLKEAFNEAAIEREFTIQDLKLLIVYLERYQQRMRTDMYLLIPYISRYMGIANCIAELNQYLSRTINETKVLMKEYKDKDDTRVSNHISNNLMFNYKKLGECSIELRNMIGAGKKDIYYTVNSINPDNVC